MNPTAYGALKGLASVAVFGAITAVLSWLSVAGNLNGIVSPGIAAIVVMFATSLEEYIKANSGKALFGSVRVY